MRCWLAVLGLLFVSPLAAQQLSVRQALPSEAAIEAAAKEVASLYKQEYEAAKTPLQRRALAKKLFAEANSSPDDAAGRFALLKVARKVATGSGDIALLLEIVQRTEEDFAIRPGSLKAEALDEIAPQLRLVPEWFLWGREADRTWPLLRAQGQWELASKLAKAAEAIAKKQRDTDLAKLWSERQRDVAALTEADAPLVAALARLENAPVDPVANQTAGTLLGTVRDDWPRAVPMLALSGDATLSQLTVLEMSEPTQSAELLQLADGWKNFATDRSPLESAAVLRHALGFYQQAAARAGGLDQRRAQKEWQDLFAVAMPDRFPLALITPAVRAVQNDFNPHVMTASVGGGKFSDSLWGHAFATEPSRLGFELPCECKYLVGMCALNDTGAQPAGPAVFRVLSESRELWRSPPIGELGKLVPFKVDLRSNTRIELRVQGSGNSHDVHAVWVDPMLQK